MKKIIVASLLLSAVSYGASEYFARQSHDMKRVAAGLPTGKLVLPDLPAPGMPQREVVDFDPAPNTDLRTVKPSPNASQVVKEADHSGATRLYKSPAIDLEPIDPYRREQMYLARDYDSVNEKVRHGIWVFPLLGLLLIVWRKLEEARIKRVMETIALEGTQSADPAKEASNIPPT